MKKHVSRSLALMAVMMPITSFALSTNEIYPARPYETEKIRSSIERMTENSNFLWNIYEMEKQTLEMRNTKVQPWGGHFWSLNNGMIAVDYHDPIAPIEIVWQWNAADYFNNRAVNIHKLGIDLPQNKLNKLSPAEKYDLLLGDTSFDLTNKIWNYASSWGSKKKLGFLKSIEMPEGYSSPKPTQSIAYWEGICHGWATASGYVPRPEKTVNVKLPNGKNLPFYPDDLKALASLMWAHSDVQNRVLVEGGRCNQKDPKKDKYGRYTDTEIDLNETQLNPNCADVHPAIFHVSLLNILGIEGRSFVLDHNPAGSVGNQPVSGYTFSYFNPITGKNGTLTNSLLSVAELGSKDKFVSSRNPETTHIVGVEMTIRYVNWATPTKLPTDSMRQDKIIDMDFNYDLEISADGRIVGGQWRINKDGSAGGPFSKPNMPDFFWTVPTKGEYKWQNFFQNNTDVPEWDFEKSNTPPAEYKQAALWYHNMTLKEQTLCTVLPLKGLKGEKQKVDCTYVIPKPSPMVNVVNKLIELSRK